MKYLLLDCANLYYRALHAAYRGAAADERVDFSVHVMLQSLGAAWRNQNADHIIIALEGRSWRKSFYPPYKADRVIKAAAATEKEKEENALFAAAFQSLIDFFAAKTNVTILQHSELEADDLIAGWIQSHPVAEHVIISSDSDFHQLLAHNVTQYNGVTEELYTINGVYKKGKAKIDKKTKVEVVIDPEFILFEKCVRGDPTDNVFSAYPGVRKKGSKNKVGLLEAFADRKNKGYAWNNIMLQRWGDHNDVEHRVLDDYNRNVTLIDLSAQPNDIKDKIQSTIKLQAVTKAVPMVGTHFLKLCGKFGLDKLSNQAIFYANMLGSAYPKGETNV